MRLVWTDGDGGSDRQLEIGTGDRQDIADDLHPYAGQHWQRTRAIRCRTRG
jgi:hypothetical protein